MRTFLVSVLVVAAAIVAQTVAPREIGAAESAFDRFFADGSMRIDLYHSGEAARDGYSLDEVRREPHWGGSRVHLVDTLNLGESIVRVYDLATNALIYSCGYSTVFGEWRTTGEALAGFTRTFHESIVFPYPRGKVQVQIASRDKKNVYRPVWDLVVDPADYHVNDERRRADLRVIELMGNKDPANAVDIVVLGDGYRRDEMHKLRGDAERLLGILFDAEPYKSRKRDFNVRLVESVSAESGIDEPRERKWRENLLGLSYNAFDIPRYVLTFSNKTIRDIAGNVPYDAIVIISNMKRYGGGGIFRQYANGSADNEFSGYVFTHEFGHSFAALGDEYYSSEVAYNDLYPHGVEPWEPNITALLDTARVKWGDLIEPGTAVPTPDDSLHANVVGCFEGAGYSAKGLYRPMRDCRMFSKTLGPFCPVCRRAIERMIDWYAR